MWLVANGSGNTATAATAAVQVVECNEMGRFDGFGESGLLSQCAVV